MATSPRHVRRHGWVLGLSAAIAVGGCIATSEGSARPSALVTTASPTPNPNEQEVLRRTPGPTPRPTAPAVASLPPTAASTASPSPPTFAPTPSPSPYAADLEALLPAELRGVALRRFSFPASTICEGCDFCSVVCAREIPALAKELGADAREIDLAVAFADRDEPNAPHVAIVAYRVAGVATERLVEARLESLQHEGLPRMAVVLEIGGKTVTWATYSALPIPSSMEYLYARGDVLFRVVDGVDLQPGVATPADTVLAIRALP